MASPRAETLVSDLARLMISAIVIDGDVGDAACVEKTLALVKKVRLLCCLINTAHVLGDGLLLRLTPLRCDVIFGSKVDGAWDLYHFTRDMSLDVCSVIGWSVLSIYQRHTPQILRPYAGSLLNLTINSRHSEFLSTYWRICAFFNFAYQRLEKKCRLSM